MTPLILLPGLACDEELFREQLPALAARVPVHVSDVHDRFDTLPQMAAALLAERPGPLRLVGVSMGGMLALEVIAQAPERVQALALLGASARADTPELVALRTAAIAQFQAGGAETVLRANLPFAFHRSRHHDDALIGAYLRMVLDRAGARALARQNRALIARADRRALLPSIACPTLVMVGDSDLLTPPEHAREMAAAIAGAQLVVLEDCGHMLTWERPRDVTAALVDWLER